MIDERFDFESRKIAARARKVRTSIGQNLGHDAENHIVVPRQNGVAEVL